MFSQNKKPDAIQSSLDNQIPSDGNQNQLKSLNLLHPQTSRQQGQTEDTLGSQLDNQSAMQHVANKVVDRATEGMNDHFINANFMSDDDMVNSELAGVYQRLGIIVAAKVSPNSLESHVPIASADDISTNHKKTIKCHNKKGQFLMNTLDKHTSKSFDMELEETISLFLKMGNTAVNQVAKAIHALIDADEVLAKEVIKADHDINQMEIDLDELILLLVAKRQPAAVDLRLIMAISKGVVDLERIGDEAVKIAQMAVQVVEEGSSPRGYSEVQHLSNQVRLMTHNAMEAFSHQDVDQAFDVMRNDGVINEEYQSATRSLMTYIMEDSRHVSKVINIMWVLRALERIGDHARNIAELVIYSSSGTDVRHTDFSQVEKTIQEVTEQRAARQALTDSQISESNIDNK